LVSCSRPSSSIYPQLSHDSDMKVSAVKVGQILLRPHPIMPKTLLNPPPDPAMPIIQPIFSSQPPILHGHSVIIHRKFRRLSQYVPKHLPAQHPVQNCLKFGRFAANSIPLLSKLSGPMDDYPRLTQAGTVATSGLPCISKTVPTSSATGETPTEARRGCS
jgi:hypothetical protein